MSCVRLVQQAQQLVVKIGSTGLRLLQADSRSGECASTAQCNR